MSGDVQQDNSRYSNPVKKDEEGAANGPPNPLSTGKKDVVETPLQDWGSLRYGIPKESEAFGLPAQGEPRSKVNYDPNGNDASPAGGIEAAYDTPRFPKDDPQGNNVGNSVM